MQPAYRPDTQGLLKGQSTNWSFYPGTQYSWKQLYDSLRSAGLLDLLDLPADQTPNNRGDIQRYNAEYKARPEVRAARAEYIAEY
jgi:hypothetical protein